MRRSGRTLAMLVPAVAVLGGSAWMTAPVPSPAPDPLVDVVIATRDVPVGDRLGPEDVEVTSRPASTVAAGALAIETDAVGRVVGEPLLAGEPVHPSRLDTPATRIPAGWAAVAIPLVTDTRGSVGCVAAVIDVGDGVVEVVTVAEQAEVVDWSSGVAMVAVPTPELVVHGDAIGVVRIQTYCGPPHRTTPSPVRKGRVLDGLYDRCDTCGHGPDPTGTYAVDLPRPM